jgi:serine phosphatase RsbU (regulator of sigma subunit)
MKLRTQFFVGVAVLVAVLLGMALSVVLTRMHVSDLRNQQEIARTLEQQANDLAYLSSNYLLYREATQKTHWDSVLAAFVGGLERMEHTARDAAVLDGLKANAERLRLVFDDVTATMAGPGGGAAAGGVAGGGGAAGGGGVAGGSGVADTSFLQLSWSRMEVQNRQLIFGAIRLERMFDESAARAYLVSNILVFAMIGVFGLLLLAAYLTMHRRTMAGITALRKGTSAVGRGDLDYKIPGGRRDEFGDLSRAFNTMTTDLQEVTASKSRLETEIAYRMQAEAERERLLLEANELAHSLAYANDRLQEQNEELTTREEELAVQNEELRIAEEQTARLLAERSALFEQLQNALVHVPQERPGVRFGHLYRSATKQALVGGDFYDVFETKDGGIGLLIGDVSGHGIEAARVATLVKDTVHAFAHRFGRPHLVLRDTNRLLVEKDLPGFVTAFLGFLDPENGVLKFCSAGHPPPLLASEGTSGFLEMPAVPLGVFADARYKDVEVTVAKGSLLLLYTDGITDARVGSELFGEEGVMAALDWVPMPDAETLPSLLLADALRFSGDQLNDDVALLAVKYVGPEGEK